jgi:hypothetical protein
MIGAQIVRWSRSIVLVMETSPTMDMALLRFYVISKQVEGHHMAQRICQSMHLSTSNPRPPLNLDLLHQKTTNNNLRPWPWDPPDDLRRHGHPPTPALNKNNINYHTTTSYNHFKCELSNKSNREQLTNSFGTCLALWCPPSCFSIKTDSFF